MSTDNSSTNITIKITKYLLSKSAVHYADLMEYTNLSRKTVSKYLDCTAHFLAQSQVTLVRKRGTGIYLTGNIDLLRGNLAGASNVDNDDQTGRSKLLLLLLDQQSPILLDELAERLFVSRSTLERELTYLKGHFGLKLKKARAGIILNNDELEIRQILSQLVEENWHQEVREDKQTGQMVQKFEVPHFLNEFVDQEGIEKAHLAVQQFLNKYDMQIDEYQYESFLVHIALSLKRIKQHKYIEQDEILDLGISTETVYLLSLLEKAFKVAIPSTEAKYLELFVAVINDNFGSFRNVRLIGELTWWLKHTLARYDDELLRNLAFHLMPALKRGKIGVTIQNPYAQEIKKNFPSAFDQALDLTIAIQHHFKVVLPENEIAYMALHLELFTKRHPPEQKNISLVIVCSSGYGTSQLLRQRVLETVKDVNVVHTMSVTEFIASPPTVDIVLSTVPLKFEKAKVIQVSPFLNQTEVALLKKVCAEIRKRNYVHSDFMELLHPECIIAGSANSDRTSVITEIADRLKQFGYVDHKMAHAALKREHLASTKIGHIAIPHGGLEHVLRPALGILTSPAGIDWGKGKVHLVFFIAFNQQLEDKIDNIYTYFYNLIKNKRLSEQMIMARSAHEIIQSLAKNGLEDQ